MRWAAAAGVLFYAGLAAYESFPFAPRQAYGLYVLGGTLGAVLLAVRWLMPRVRVDLLVPLGVRCGAVAALEVLLLWPAWGESLGRATSFELFGVTWTISAWGAVVAVLDVVYAAWATLVVVRAARGEDSRPAAALRDVPRLILRTFGFMAICVLALLLPVGWAIALWRPSGIDIWPLAVALAVVAVVLNLATAALLLAGLPSRASFLGAFVEGIHASVRNARRWWHVVLAQMLVLGWVMYLRASYVVDGVHTTTSRWKVQATWTGGYAEISYWHRLIMELVRQEPSSLVTAGLTLLLGVLAVAVKWNLASRLWHGSASSYSSVFR